MRKCILESYTTDHKMYKGENYMRGFLTFKIVILFIFVYRKTIIYDVTMFEVYENYKNHWDDMIEQKKMVPFSIIKNREIFNKKTNTMKNTLISIRNAAFHVFYLILKKDIIRKLRENHGSQFVDDVTESLGIPSNLMAKYYNYTTNVENSRCCGRCDGVNDICVAETACDDHEIVGCENCFGKR